MGVGASIVLLVGLPILMLVKRPELVAAIERETAGTLSEEWMARVLLFVMIYSIVLHLLDVILLVRLTPKVLRGRQWARITLTAYLVIAPAGSLYSASMGGMDLAVVIPTDILHVLMVMPPSAAAGAEDRPPPCRSKSCADDRAVRAGLGLLRGEGRRPVRHHPRHRPPLVPDLDRDRPVAPRDWYREAVTFHRDPAVAETREGPSNTLPAENATTQELA